MVHEGLDGVQSHVGGKGYRVGIEKVEGFISVGGGCFSNVTTFHIEYYRKPFILEAVNYMQQRLKSFHSVTGVEGKIRFYRGRVYLFFENLVQYLLVKKYYPFPHGACF